MMVVSSTRKIFRRSPLTTAPILLLELLPSDKPELYESSPSGILLLCKLLLSFAILLLYELLFEQKEFCSTNNVSA